jgi:hypothetical protein
VHLDGVDIGPIEKRLIGAGVVGLDPFDEFVLPQKLGRRSLEFRLGRWDRDRGRRGPRNRGGELQAQKRSS